DPPAIVEAPTTTEAPIVHEHGPGAMHVPYDRFHGPPRLYVTEVVGESVDVIDPDAMKVLDRFKVGRAPHHMQPTPDGSFLYVGNASSYSVTVIDLAAAKPSVVLSPVDDPYNIMVTPDLSRMVTLSTALD